MNSLDTYQFSLSGAALIEASAGTGKTYTIVNLYLRLLLGHHCRLSGEGGLSVEQILVVTFTNAATAELKQRIGQRIHSAYLDFFAGHSDDNFVQQLIDDTADRRQACERLSLAAKQMDEASVFTIHSFCQRILSEFAFESGSAFGEQLELDQSPWVKQSVEDYWRTKVVPLGANAHAFVRQIWASPDALQAQLAPLLSKHFVTSQQVSVEQAQAKLSELQALTMACKRWWVDEQVSAQLQQAKLKGNTKLGKPALYQKMDAFCQSDHIASPFDNGWQDLFPAKVASARGKTSADISHLDFARFEHLHQLSEQTRDAFKLAFLADALAYVRIALDSFKRSINRLTPDDLLARLQQALTGRAGQHLASLIRRKFPAAMIDEFQDTDQTQFQIFSQIYPLQELAQDDYCVVMIGDPKQAIYAFRGADIFTYIQAKREVASQRHFTLDKNWRSNANMVAAVNRLFDSSQQGFLFNQDIPFQPVKSARPACQLRIAERPVDSLEFWLLQADSELLKPTEAKPALATHLANQVVDLLQHGQLVDSEQGVSAVSAGDICILVRDRNEASLVKSTLAQAQVPSVFLVRQSVFAGQSAADLYRLLDALINPGLEHKVKAAVASGLMCLSAQQLEQLFTDELAWQRLVDQFFGWQQGWERHGIMRTLNQILQYFAVFSKLVGMFEDGARRLTDLRHLTELLQQQSAQLTGANQLLYWLGQQIQDPDHNSDAQQLRLETDANLVQILTMHASKGLEFPFVFIPFASSYRPVGLSLFHDEDLQLKADFLDQAAEYELAEKERLAEDIRLLYVALTRAIHYCFVGCWNPTNPQQSRASGLKLCALGAVLLHNEDEANWQILHSRLQQLVTDGQVGLVAAGLESLNSQQLPIQRSQNTDYRHATLAQPVARNWRTTSYSAIAKHQHQIEHERPGTDEQETSPAAPSQQPRSPLDSQPPRADRFGFPRGAQAGSFLHGVLENIQLAAADNLPAVISQQSQWYGIEEQWHSVALAWLQDVLVTPIAINAQPDAATFCLAQLGQQQVSVEMEFYLPLKSVQVRAFNQLINSVFTTTQRQYQFEQLNGMLKGFIDLTFCWEGKFYVADYKSNHLGDDFEHYQYADMHNAMSAHDYHLQSLLYILALHRHLRAKLTDYDYDQHVGGAHYWFLRGMSAQQPARGCYFYKPEFSIINRLDRLFAGQSADEPPLPAAEPAQMGLFE